MGDPMTPRVRNHIDFATLVAVLALMLLGLGVVYSASSAKSMSLYADSESMLGDHTLRVAVAIILIFVMMRIDYHIFMKFTKLALVASVGLLVFTLLYGVATKGASRWIFGLQPSEFAKYALLFHLCTMFAVKGDLVRDFRRGYLPMMVWIGLIAGLVVLQPNYSTALMVIILSAVVLFVGGVSFKHLFFTGLAAVPVLGVVLVVAPYRLDRIRDYLEILKGNINRVDHWQLYQGMIAFARGGIFGVGPGESRQRDYFLPEAHNDFVYSIVGEEYGFVGAIFFMLLFLLIMYRGYRIARYAPDGFGRNMAIAITTAVTGYAFVNACVTLGLLPTTGLPMTFVSYGGSSLVFSGAAIGILLNISSQTDLHPRATQVPVVGDVNAGRSAVGKVY